MEKTLAPHLREKYFSIFTVHEKDQDGPRVEANLTRCQNGCKLVIVFRRKSFDETAKKKRGLACTILKTLMQRIHFYIFTAREKDQLSPRTASKIGLESRSSPRRSDFSSLTTFAKMFLIVYDSRAFIGMVFSKNQPDARSMLFGSYLYLSGKMQGVHGSYMGDL